MVEVHLFAYWWICVHFLKRVKCDERVESHTPARHCTRRVLTMRRQIVCSLVIAKQLLTTVSGRPCETVDNEAETVPFTRAQQFHPK